MTIVANTPQIIDSNYKAATDTKHAEEEEEYCLPGMQIKKLIIA